jgi:hypothetical protein
MRCNRVNSSLSKRLGHRLRIEKIRSMPMSIIKNLAHTERVSHAHSPFWRYLLRDARGRNSRLTEAITPLCQRMIEYERAAKKPASACKTIRIFLLWLVSVPFPHGVLLLFFILKERLLKLTFDADEPFFGTSGTAPKIICFFLECTCSFFGCAQL